MKKKQLKNKTLKDLTRQNQQPKFQLKKNRYADLLGVGIIILLGIILYSNSFECSFHFDDLNNIVNNSKIRDLHDVKTLWNISHTRFIAYYTFALNYHFNHLDVWGYHLVNLAIHLINACIVWWLTLLIFSSPVLRENSIAKHKMAIAFFTAMLFVSHPLATQSVTYIIQRLASLAAMFYLLSLALYMKARLTELHNLSKYTLFAGSLISAILAMLTKENAFTLPFAIVLVELFFLQTKKLSVNFKDYRIILFVAALIITSIVVFFTFSLAIFKPIPPSLDHPHTVTSLNYLVTQMTVILKYIRLLFLPVHQNVDYDYPVVSNFFEPLTLVSFLFLLSLIILAIFLFKKHRIFSFGISWFFLTLSIESGIIPISDVIFEHRTYLPSFGFFLIISSGIYFVFRNKNKYLAIVILLIVIGLNSVLTYARNKVWEDEVTLLSDVISKSPHKARPLVNRGASYMSLGQWENAIADYSGAIRINQNYFDAYNNRGAAYTNLGKLEQALVDYSRAIDIDPKFAKAYYNRGITYGNLGQWDKAIIDYTTAIDIDPKIAKVYYSRGYAHWQMKQLDQSISDYSTSIQLDPNDAKAYFNRGLVYGNLGQWEKAISDYSKAIELDPKEMKIFESRGFAYANLGRWKEAIADYTRSIDAGLKNANAYYNRGYTYSNLGQWEKAIADYSKAIEIDPNLRNAYINRDIAYSKLHSEKK